MTLRHFKKYLYDLKEEYHFVQWRSWDK